MAAAARVLVVDDSPTIRRVVSSVLLRAGHEVATAEDGERGIDELATFDPDLVLLDVTMPVLDGQQVLERAHELMGDEGPPIILMATRGDDLKGVDDRLRRLGVVDVITKPFSPEALLAVVHHSLEKHGARQRPDQATRVVIAMASIAAAESDTEAAVRSRGHASDFADDEHTIPARPAANTTIAGTQIQSTQQGAPVVDGHAGDRARGGNGVSSAPGTRGVDGHALALPTGVVLMGELATIALPEILQLLKFQALTGSLVVESDGVRYDVGLVSGNIVSVVARDIDTGVPSRRDELRLGSYLVASGISAEHIERHIERHIENAPQDGEPVGERLVRVGAITRDQLSIAVAEQVQDFMVELLRARRGLFGLRAGEAHVPAYASRPGWSIDALLFEALRRIDEWGVIESEVPSFEARFGGLDAGGLSDDEATILRAFSDGALRVKDVVRRATLRPFDTCRVIYRLAVLKRIVRVDDGDPRRLLSDDSPPSEPVLSTPPRRADS